MPDVDSNILTALSILGASAWLIVTYEGVADSKGWPVGRWFSGTNALVVFAILMLFGVGISTFFINPWWLPLLALLIANIACRIALVVLRSTAQAVALCGLAFAIFLLGEYRHDLIRSFSGDPEVAYRQCIDEASKRPTDQGVRAAIYACKSAQQQGN